MSNTNENEIGNQPVTISPFSELPICINETEQDRYRREVRTYLLFSENCQKIGHGTYDFKSNAYSIEALYTNYSKIVNNLSQATIFKKNISHRS